MPFIADMPAALAAADLVIGRSGAGAVSEICAVGRPSVLIPYPFASGDHQRVNAESLVRAEAALCLPIAEASPARIAAEIAALLNDPSRLIQMAARAAALGRPAAAHAIAVDLLGLAGLSNQERREAPSPARAGSSEPNSPEGSDRFPYSQSTAEDRAACAGGALSHAFQEAG